METHSFLVSVCNMSCSCCLEDQQCGCVKVSGGTLLCHMPRLSSQWLLPRMVLYYPAISDLIPQWHSNKSCGSVPPVTDNMGFGLCLLLDQWPRISSGPGNILTSNPLAFSTPYEQNFFKRNPLQLWGLGSHLNVCASLSTLQSLSLYSLFSKTIHITFLILNYFMISVSWVNLNWKEKGSGQTKFLTR